MTRKYKGMQQNKTEHTTITYRDIKNLNKEQFIAALKEAPWDSAFIFDDPDDVVDAWYVIFQGLVDRFLPLKHKRVKRKSQPKWFNNNISSTDLRSAINFSLKPTKAVPTTTGLITGERKIT